MKKLKRYISDFSKPVLNKLPYVKTLHKLNSNSKFPAGHYYSSVVSLPYINTRQEEIWPTEIEKSVHGINLNEEFQLNYFKTLSESFSEMGIPEKKEPHRRYFFQNSYFSYGDGLILGAILKNKQPKQVVEVGSGFSSAVMLDINEFYLDNSIALTFIEPYPEVRLDHILTQGYDQNVRKITKRIQEVDVEEFKRLNRGDILFIDSSHIVKTGSDVNYILFKILPVLKAGVLIHFHDIHFPFEYPKQWILDGFGWNETYFLRSFLMFNDKFKILLFSDFLYKFHRDKIFEVPFFQKSPGSSLWLEKND